MIIHGRLGWIYGLKTTCKINFHSCPHRNSSCGPTKDGESEQPMNMAMFFNLAVIMVCIDWSQIKETCVRFCKCVHCEVHIVDYELALSCTVNEKAANKCKSSTCVPYYISMSGISPYYMLKMYKSYLYTIYNFDILWKRSTRSANIACLQVWYTNLQLQKLVANPLRNAKMEERPLFQGQTCCHATGRRVSK